MDFLYNFGKYLLMLKAMFSRPENWRIYWDETMRNMVSIGISSLPIVTIINVFTGAVTTVQTAYQLISNLIPKSVIGQIVSDSTILELAPTITCLVLAGKIGSSIASEIGTMKVTEQIDALEIMGINPISYLVAPKIIAALITVPILVIYGMVLGIGGASFVGNLTGLLTYDQFFLGARETFSLYNVYFALIKAVTYAFAISSIASFQGFYTSGGALEVGRSSTKAVVYACVVILFSDYLLAQLLL